MYRNSLLFRHLISITPCLMGCLTAIISVRWYFAVSAENQTVSSITQKTTIDVRIVYCYVIWFQRYSIYKNEKNISDFIIVAINIYVLRYFQSAEFWIEDKSSLWCYCIVEFRGWGRNRPQMDIGHFRKLQSLGDAKRNVMETRNGSARIPFLVLRPFLQTFSRISRNRRYL